METPICEVCIKSKILCKACKEKLEKKEISKPDIEVSRLIYKISKDAKTLKDVSIKKVIELSNLIVIVCKEGDAAKIVGKTGIIVKKLSKELGKPIKVIEESKNKKEFLQNLLFPTPILGINILYTPKEEILRIRIPKRKIMPTLRKSINEFAKHLFNKKVEIIEE